MDLAFADDALADAGASFLAGKLGQAMDGRSPANLLVLLGAANADIGSARVWTFPRDDAFRFDESAAPTIELLADVFSRTSGLRKAAQFDGEAHDASFIAGRALDFQTGSSSIDIANYWIGRFLDCRLGVTPAVGTQLAARAMRKLDSELTNPQDRQMLTAAAIALRQSTRPNWTLADIAETFLPPDLGGRLLASSERPDMNHATFSLSPDTFDTIVSTRVFSLESGVVVASPLSEVGEAGDQTKPVTVDGDQLRCEGTITRETLRGRRRSQAA